MHTIVKQKDRWAVVVLGGDGGRRVICTTGGSPWIAGVIASWLNGGPYPYKVVASQVAWNESCPVAGRVTE